MFLEDHVKSLHPGTVCSGEELGISVASSLSWVSWSKFTLWGINSLVLMGRKESDVTERLN